jgi:hypothetical protein
MAQITNRLFIDTDKGIQSMHLLQSRMRQMAKSEMP